MKALFTTLVYQPIYNGLVAFIDLIPGGDVGLAVILITLLVKFILAPLSIKSVKTQMKMREIEPELKALQEKYKDKREQQAMAMMELYKKHNIKPFSGFLVLLIQIPVVLALYSIILSSGLPEIRDMLLYTFIPMPENVSMIFLGIVNVAEKSLILALLTALTQFIQMRLAMPGNKKKEEKKPLGERSFREDFQHTLQFQMRYIFPIVAGVISYTLSAVIALYWTTSNIFHIGQELYVRAFIKKRQLDASTASETK